VKDQVLIKEKGKMRQEKFEECIFIFKYISGFVISMETNVKLKSFFLISRQGILYKNKNLKIILKNINKTKNLALSRSVS
jgi:hypothetical protein